MKISWPKGMERWKAVLERYRYALLVVAVGALLLLLPTGGTQPAAEERQTDRETFFQLEELEELFDISFDESEFETLNGFLIAKLEHIPEPDEQFDIRIDGYDFKVLSVENKMIKTVLVKKLPEESGAACEERPLSGKTEEDRRSSGQDKAGESGNK